jgi:hypothetical protein
VINPRALLEQNQECANFFRLGLMCNFWFTSEHGALEKVASSSKRSAFFLNLGFDPVGEIVDSAFTNLAVISNPDTSAAYGWWYQL